MQNHYMVQDTSQALSTFKYHIFKHPDVKHYQTVSFAPGSSSMALLQPYRTADEVIDNLQIQQISLASIQFNIKGRDS